MSKLGVRFVALAIVASTPTMLSAQQADDDVTRTAESADREDRGEWGWLGLLGLAGLLGLKKRDRVETVTRDRAATTR